LLYPINIKRAAPFAAVLLLLALSTNLPAQSQPEQRPKTKDFGSSLDRLKWDPSRGEAVEEKSEKKNANAGSANDDVVKVETNLVICSVSVLDQHGKVVPNLKKEDFILTENGQSQDVYHFSLGNDLDVPRTIVLVIDYSGSQSPFIKESVTAAKILVDKLGPKDLMAIVTDDVKLLVDFTRDKKELKKALDSLYSKSKKRDFGKSKQFSALMAVIREMFTAEDVRPIVIFQTDGDQILTLQPSTPPILDIPTLTAPTLTTPILDAFREHFSLRDLYQTIERSRASVYTVIPGRPQIDDLDSRELPVVQPQPGGRETLLRVRVANFVRWQQMAAAGAAIGGWTAYLQKPEEASDIYGRILDDINSRYVLGYYPSDKTRDGKRRQVQVEVRGHPEYTVTGRKSYFAPPGDL
jgi:VWFA-related protein